MIFLFWNDTDFSNPGGFCLIFTGWLRTTTSQLGNLWEVQTYFEMGSQDQGKAISDRVDKRQYLYLIFQFRKQKWRSGFSVAWIDHSRLPFSTAYCWVDWAKIWPIVQRSSQTRNMWNVAKNTIILHCNGGQQAFQSTLQIRILRIDIWWRDCNLKVQKKIEKWSLQWESNPRPYAY